MTPFETGQFVRYMGETMEILYNLPQITIALIDGAALGGGLEIALNCDLRYSTDTAKLGLPELNLAIIPGIGGTQLLPRIVGLQKAKEMIYFSRILSGQEAKSSGLVCDSFETKEAMDQALEQKLLELQNKGPLALRAAKEAINGGFEVDLKRGLEIERLAYYKVLMTEDRIEGLKAFSEKRKPVYNGK